MRSGIHPKYKPLTILIGDDRFLTASAHHSDELLMDVDFRNHVAWRKDNVNMINESNQNVSKFNKKFSGLNFGV